MKAYLKDYSSTKLQEWLQNQNQSAFRAKQIREWLYKKWAISANEMSNLPKDLRNKLAESFRVFTINCTTKRASGDGTIKYLVSLPDKSSVETVLIPATGRRNTVCVSTQVGCPVRCTFCASGKHGLYRNLTAQEIVDQVIFVCREHGEQVTNVVLMGVGEPLLNLRNLHPALDTFSQPWGLDIGARQITVSTSGIVPGIYDLADAERQWNLAVSLHAATDETRAQIIPAQYRYPLSDIVEACRYYREKTRRMVTIEYALIDQMNDHRSDAEELALVAKALKAKVNLIPYNITNSPYESPETHAAHAFLDHLKSRGVRITVRQSRGDDINAACGQLRANP